MNLLWDFYSPAVVAAVIIGVMAGRIAFQRFADQRRILAFAAGAIAAVALTALWHGPLGVGAPQRVRAS